MSSARNPSGEEVSGHFARPRQNPIKEKVETIFMTFSIILEWICQRDVFIFQMSIIILSKVNRFEINESIDHFLKMLFTTEKKKENLF